MKHKPNILKYSAIFATLILVGCTTTATTTLPVRPDNTAPEPSVIIPTNQLEHIRQGIMYSNQGDFPNAIVEFKASIAVRPTPDAYANLGAAYMQQGKTNLAMASLKKGERLDPRHALVLYNLTSLYAINDQTDLALVYLGKALDNGFSNFDAIRFDSDLMNLRGEPEFRQVLEQHHVFIQ